MFLSHVLATFGSDYAVVRKALDVLSRGAAAASVAVMAFSEDDSGKLVCLAVVPPACPLDIKADDWVNAALAPCGGRGGGKGAAAQGQASGPSADDKAAALEAAAAFAQRPFCK